MQSNISETIASIHAGVFDFALADFKLQSMERLRHAIGFDSAIWASGKHDSATIYSIATINYGQECLIEYATRWQGDDFVRAAAVAAPGKTLRNEDIMPIEQYRRTTIYREFSSPSGIEHTLATAIADPVTTAGEMIYLFRADKNAAFTDEERDVKQVLATHLVSAWRHKQVMNVIEAKVPALLPTQTTGHAITDDSGLIEVCDDVFCARLTDAFPAWKGPGLPFGLNTLLCEPGHEAVINGTRFRVSPEPGRNLVTACIPATHTRLTRAEMRAARLYAQGATTVTVAKVLGVSQSTVRNQLAAVYDKLAVHNKVELAKVLGGLA